MNASKTKAKTKKKNSRGSIYAALFILLLLGFMLVLYSVQTNRVSQFDDTIRFFLYSSRTPLLSSILIPLTYLGNWQAVTAISVLLILIPRTRFRAGLPSGIGALLSHSVNHMVKGQVCRARPDVIFHLIAQGGYSFPSGHSMTGMFFYGMLLYSARRMLLEFDAALPEQLRKKRIYCARALTVFGILLIGLIGISRIYVGVHFPSDVLGGWLLGGALLMLAIMIREKRKSRTEV